MVARVQFGVFETGITVPYPAFSEPTRQNYGFVDLRGRPDLASKICEGMQSNALSDILVALAQPTSAFFTVGCDLGTKRKRQRHFAGGYIQIVHSEYAEKNPDDYRAVGQSLAVAIKEQAQDHKWTIKFMLQFVEFKLDDLPRSIPSLFIWFDASARSEDVAFASREALLRGLKGELANSD